MAITLEEMIGSKNLTDIVQGIVGGIPDDILPASLTGTTRSIQGYKGTYQRRESDRKNLPLRPYGSPSDVEQQTDREEIPFRCFHTVRSQIFDPALMVMLNSSDGNTQKLGMDEVAVQTEELGRKLRNTYLTSIYSTMGNGAVYSDADGNLLPNSTGATYTHDFGVPAGNKDQLAVFGTDLITAAWSTAGTDIGAAVANLRLAARKLTGYKLKYAFYGSAILGDFLGNTLLATAMSRNAAYSAAFTAGEMPNPFLGLTWIPINEAFMEDTSSTSSSRSYTDFFASDTVIFTPEFSRDWFEIFEGQTPVPSSIDVRETAVASMQSVNLVNGPFGYSVNTIDPVQIKQVIGSTWFPALKVPKAIFQANVDS